MREQPHNNYRKEAAFAITWLSNDCLVSDGVIT